LLDAELCQGHEDIFQFEWRSRMMTLPADSFANFLNPAIGWPSIQLAAAPSVMTRCTAATLSNGSLDRCWASQTTRPR
jgi:hypothetical protein